MSVWTMQQVEQARGVRAQMQVDSELVARGRVDIVAEGKRTMVKSAIRHAEPFVIDLHPEDFRFRETPGEKEWEPITITCWWEPHTNEVELQGGENDGAVYAVRGAPWEPLVVAVSSGHPLVSDTDDFLPRPEVVRFECVGWIEDRRRWLYARKA